MAKTRIIIPRDGIASGEQKPRAISDAISAKLLIATGRMTTKRASEVEPGQGLRPEALESLPDTYVIREPGQPPRIRPEFANHWFADMTPVAPGIVLGPWAPSERATALAQEVEWLHQHNIPTADNPLPPQSPAATTETKTNDNSN